MTRRALLGLLAFLLVGCSSRRLSGSALDEVRRPAFISRITLTAGPHSHVFQDDGSYRDKLKKLAPQDADRRLEAKLASSMTRFELSERLRVATFRQLPREAPWLNTVDPAQVATVLESFLVEEVPALQPDYDLLKTLRADTVVEFVIEDYGMRSKRGKAGAYLKGYARMFWLEGRSELWRHPFHLDEVDGGVEHLDPFKVGKTPALFRERMTDLVDVLSSRFAEDLTPKERNAGVPPRPDARPETEAPGRERPVQVKPRPPELPPGELPDPD
ncbi:hypothetical protein F0U62_26635 [Cystobacter fuscus]|uniref:hypothetical protein n=1 Tax=Cystobacter fuscus TaxID=43 RepID=UPI002B2CF749|nr:hypothetical protein F0U62_26635 [Cystobacter fuscus]